MILPVDELMTFLCTFWQWMVSVSISSRIDFFHYYLNLQRILQRDLFAIKFTHLEYDDDFKRLQKPRIASLK